MNAASGAAAGGAAATAALGAAAAAPASFTECSAVGMVERPERVNELANLLRSLCASYCTHATHTVVLRMQLPAPPGAPPGGTSSLVRLVRRLPGNIVHAHGSGGARPSHPFMEEPPERWEVRHEGPPLQGPALNALPASMREVLDTACYGAGALDFWKALGGKLEYELYREGNEYHIVFHGYEVKVVLAHVFSLTEPHSLTPATLKRVSGALTVEVAVLVPEGRHYEGANLVGVFGAQLAPYVKLIRAEVPPAVAAARRK